MPDTAKPLSESEIESICAYLSDSSISLPAEDMVSTRELGLVLESAVAFEQRLVATIRKLQAENRRLVNLYIDSEKEGERLEDLAEKAEKALHDANNRIMIAEAKTEGYPAPRKPSITVTIKPSGDIEIDGAGPDVRIVDERTP